MAYEAVNAAWPEGTRNGRALKPTPQEALAGARRLYRIAMKHPFRGKMKLISGNRRTWIRSGVFLVNPDEGSGPPRYFIEGVPQDPGGGWHEIVHAVSHYATQRLYPKARNHGPQHAFMEKLLIEEVVKRGWLEGKLKRLEKPKPDLKAVRRQRVLARLAEWEARRARAERAVRKLKRQKAYYEARVA